MNSAKSSAMSSAWVLPGRTRLRPGFRRGPGAGVAVARAGRALGLEKSLLPDVSFSRRCLAAWRDPELESLSLRRLSCDCRPAILDLHAEHGAVRTHRTAGLPADVRCSHSGAPVLRRPRHPGPFPA